MIPCVVLYHARADALWAMTDILSAIYVMITILFIVTQQKEIFRLFNDFWFRYLPAKERGRIPRQSPTEKWKKFENKSTCT
jgi:alanine or glycine:cation symporter, AGCS family